MPTIISQNLRRLCMVKELTYPLEEGQTVENVRVKTSELSRRSGVSERTIGRILTGEHVPDGSTTIKLEKALGQVQNTLLRGAIETSNKHLKEFKAKQDRKDFTKFERELGQNKEKCFWCGKPSDDKYQITMWAWGQKNVFHICQECENKERKDREARATARAKEIQSIKRQIITAVCLIVITFFIAFYFAL